MFEYIEIENDSWFNPGYTKIWNDKGKLYYESCAYKCPEFLRESRKECKCELPEFVSRLKRMHIPLWKREYKLPKDVCVLDGFKWTVKYKVSGKGVVIRTGDNNVPFVWDDFMDLIESVTEE